MSRSKNPTSTLRNGRRKMESVARVSLEHSQSLLMLHTHQMSGEKKHTHQFLSCPSLSLFLHLSCTQTESQRFQNTV